FATLPEPLDQVVADARVHAGNLFIGRRPAGADGPYGLIGHYDLVLTGCVRDRGCELPFNDGFGVAAVAFRLRLADANDRLQPRTHRCLGLGTHELIALTMLRTAL